MRKQYHIFYLLLAFTLLLFPGCSDLSDAIGAYRNSYRGLWIHSVDTGVGPCGPVQITRCDFDGFERIGPKGLYYGRKYNPTPPAWKRMKYYTAIARPKDFRPHLYFGKCAASYFAFPHTIEVTWFIFEEQQLYRAMITMPSYEELQKIMEVKKFPDLGIGLFVDMPPQVKCFVFDTHEAFHRDTRYYLAATGMGTPVEIVDQVTRYYFDLLTLDICKEDNRLPEKVCAKYRNSGPDARKRLLRLITRGG